MGLHVQYRIEVIICMSNTFTKYVDANMYMEEAYSICMYGGDCLSRCRDQ